MSSSTDDKLKETISSPMNEKVEPEKDVQNLPREDFRSRRCYICV